MRNSLLENHVEVVMQWRDTVLGMDHLRPGASFHVAHPHEGEKEIELVCHKSNQVVVRVASWMRAKKNDHEIAAGDHVLATGDIACVSQGAFDYKIQIVESRPLVPQQIFDYIDRFYAKVLTLVLLVQIAFLILIALAPVRETTSADDIFQNPERFREIVLKNEIKKTKRKIELAGKAGARHKDPEGVFGKKELPKEDKLASAKGAPVVDKDKREEDRKIAMNMLSKLGLNKEVAKSSVLGPGGSGSGINKALGGLRGTTTGDAGGSGAMGTRGTGLGGGGASAAVGNLGSGTGRGSGGMSDLDLGGQGKSRVRVQPGAVTYEGSLTREEIQRVIDRFMAQIKYCYEREFQKEPDLEGKLLANWTISPEGDVEASHMPQNTMNNKVVEQCVLRVVNRMVFPKPRGGGIVKVNYPFVFSSAGA
jgi:hypothetical protein